MSMLMLYRVQNKAGWSSFKVTSQLDFSLYVTDHIITVKLIMNLISFETRVLSFHGFIVHITHAVSNMLKVIGNIINVVGQK